MTQPDRHSSADADLFERLIPAAVAAGVAILRIRAAGNAIDRKADHSPVTEADRVAEGILLAALRKEAPHIPVVAEEEVAAGRVPNVGEVFFLVDALDGTRDFVAGRDDFTVNIGLVRQGSAVAGIVHAPATGTTSVGIVGMGARQVAGQAGTTRVLRVRPPHPGALAIVASKSHRTPETDAFLARFTGSSIVAAGSSLKFVAVAEGAADLYPRLGPTSQWDTAAGDAVVRAAGGRVTDMDGRPLIYGPRPGQPQPYLNPWFVATGGLDPFAAPGA
jgi:3'(2'),5'-bisphosphate nucleotidase